MKSYSFPMAIWDYHNGHQSIQQLIKEDTMFTVQINLINTGEQVSAIKEQLWSQLAEVFRGK